MVETRLRCPFLGVDLKGPKPQLYCKRQTPFIPLSFLQGRPQRDNFCPLAQVSTKNCLIKDETTAVVLIKNIIEANRYFSE